MADDTEKKATPPSIVAYNETYHADKAQRVTESQARLSDPDENQKTREAMTGETNIYGTVEPEGGLGVSGADLLAYSDAFNKDRLKREAELAEAREGTGEEKPVQHIYPGTMSDEDAAALKYHMATTNKPEPDGL